MADLSVRVNAITYGRSPLGAQTVVLAPAITNERARVSESAGGAIVDASASIIAAARQPIGNTDVPNVIWASAGVEGGIPVVTTKFGSTIAAYTGTAATINTAIASASAAGGLQYVELGAGTFSLSSSIAMKTNVELRGQGMSTIVSFTSMGGVTYFWGAGKAGIIFQGAYSTPNEIAPALASVPSGTIKDFTGTNGAAGVYTQGATALMLGQSATGLSVGDTLVVWQADDADGAVPNSNYFVSSKNGVANSVCWEGSGESKASTHQQRMRVTGIAGTGASTVVTVATGLFMPTGTWQTAKAPKAGWFTVAQTIHDAGVRNLLVQSTGFTTEHLAVIAINWAVNIWVQGVGIKPRNTTFHASNACDYGIYTTDSRNITIRDNWVDRMIGGGINTTTSYGIALKTTCHSLVENNILNEVESPLMILTGTFASVLAYNYERFVNDDGQENGLAQHQVGSGENLVEGNSLCKVWLDMFHGPATFTTFYRNYMAASGFDLASYHRWHNFIGNTIVASDGRKFLATDALKINRFSSFAFRFGYPQQNADSSTTNNVALDSGVWTTAMLWGNYATTGGTVFDAAEVPSSDPNFPNAVPSTQTLPSSCRFAVRPNFFTISGIGTVTFPPMGPDVTGGDFLGGRAYKIPAQRVYDATGGAIASFDGSVYGSTP